MKTNMTAKSQHQTSFTDRRKPVENFRSYEQFMLCPDWLLHTFEEEISPILFKLTLQQYAFLTQNRPFHTPNTDR